MNQELYDTANFISYVSLNSICILAGIFGNILIMGTILINKELHTVTNVIIFNLSIADLIISFVTGPFCIFGIWFGKSYFEENRILCKLFASSCFIFCYVSFQNMILLAFNRYILLKLINLFLYIYILIYYNYI
jgi:hypothetical protein